MRIKANIQKSEKSQQEINLYRRQVKAAYYLSSRNKKWKIIQEGTVFYLMECKNYITSNIWYGVLKIDPLKEEITGEYA